MTEQDGNATQLNGPNLNESAFFGKEDGLAPTVACEGNLKMPRRLPKTRARNQLIYWAFRHGQTIEQLAAAFGLSIVRIKATLDDERNKVAVSPDPIYRNIRESLSEV